MKLLPLLLIAAAVASPSCDDFADIQDPDSIQKAKKRAEFVLLCTTTEEEGSLVCKMDEVLYRRPGVTVPWQKGDTVSAPLLEPGSSASSPDRAVIFYEHSFGKLEPRQLNLFYLSSSTNDAEALEKLKAALKE